MNKNLTKQILSLPSLSLFNLKDMYKKLYNEEIDTKSRNQLIQKIAYRLQKLEC